LDRSAVKAIVEAHIDEYLRKLGIAHWKIKVSYRLNEEKGPCRVAGQCTRVIDYNEAHVELDPDEWDEDDPKAEEKILDTLRHELFHIVLSPFDLFWNCADQLTAEDSQQEAMLHRVWDHACEKAVINLERMYLSMTSEEMKEAGPCPTPSTPSPSSSPAAPA
jgi:hypothetical protein